MQTFGEVKAWFLGQKLESIPFKESWLEYLERNLPLYARLPEDLKVRLHQKIGQFIATTYFEPQAGLELTEEMILTVAGQACLLTVNHTGLPYENLNTVQLYPSSFQAEVREANADGTISTRSVKRVGESWSRGTVVLAWDSVQHGARDLYDGQNVTFHEFAHQLDQANGNTDGVPNLRDMEAYRTWAMVLADGLEALSVDAAQGRESVLDYYGATNICEFFAVATESFFEEPRFMLERHPELYAELRSFYQLDPIDWF